MSKRLTQDVSCHSGRKSASVDDEAATGTGRQAVAVGSRAEFLQLLEQHRHQLFGFIMTLVYNLNDAEDLFQQTSVLLWQNFDRFEPGTDFVRWACTVARFHTLNFLKRRRRDRALFSDDFMLEMIAEEEGRGAEVDHRQTALAGCLDKLPPADRQLIDRCYQGDRSIKQVAEQAQCSVQATYNALSRIRRALRDCIERKLATEHSS